MDIDGVRRFHGHWCPGVALGIRVAEVALSELGPHAEDEEMVAVVETDNCAVDGIQVLTGCTFGKGNLIHLDYGKNAFTFIRRSDGRAIRILVRPDAWGRAGGEGEPPSREDRIQLILDAPLDQLFDIQEVEPRIPRRARVHESVTCTSCGERVMETRARLFRGETLCIPCFEQHERRL